RVMDAVICHLAKGIRQKRMPVAVAPVDRQIDIVGFQFLFERGDQGAILSVDWADTTEVIIMLRHCQHTLARDVFAAQDVFQKGDHLIHAFGTAKGHDQYRIVGMFTIHGYSDLRVPTKMLPLRTSTTYAGTGALATPSTTCPV